MPRPPIFYLTFANTSDQSRLQLEREEDAIRNLLKPAEKEGRIKVVTQSFASIKKVGRFLVENDNQVRIFHFGGHASGTELILTDQAARANGIATLLGQQENLQLVFLNGCSTRDQVDLLLELGIPAVIATSLAIGDRLAKAFAEHFYKAIAEQLPVEKAFNSAQALIQTMSTFYPRRYRDAFKREAETAPLWGLYTDGEPEILQQPLIPTTMSDQYLTKPALAKILVAFATPKTSPFKDWISPYLFDGDATLKMLLTDQDSPNSLKQKYLLPKLQQLLQNPSFREALQQHLDQSANMTAKQKNVVHNSSIEGANVRIGDVNVSQSQKDDWDIKNGVFGSTIKAGKDVQIGDVNDGKKD
ncbi:MAG: CHAT domain-containing protein [Bacteroidota bacterium]